MLDKPSFFSYPAGELRGIRMEPEDCKPYRADEELAHSISHGLGIVIGIAVLILLVIFASRRQGIWEVVSCAVYGTTFILLFLGSTLYHSARRPATRKALKVFDHSAIYLLIAGTYTPFALVPLRGAVGWTIFGAIWACALLGIAFKVFFIGRFKAVSLLSYLFMGWFCVVAVKPLYRELNTIGFVMLAAGGLCYTIGAGFYAWKSLRWSHTIWHAFVLAGSLCHFFSILFGMVL
jgi:hemolysin III